MRLLTRQTRLLLRPNTRHASTSPTSTTTSAANKASEVASSTTSKAAEGLSRVTSAAGNAAGGAAAKAGSALSRIGGRAGRVVSFVDSLIPPTRYYANVGLQLGQLIVKGRNMAPPSLSEFQSAFQPLLNAARTPSVLASSVSSFTKSLNPRALLSSIRNADGQQLVAFGIVGAEALGFFTVGTMIGRMKIVGYHGGASHGH